jgi:hypothetical protein
MKKFKKILFEMQNMKSFSNYFTDASIFSQFLIEKKLFYFRYKWAF